MEVALCGIHADNGAQWCVKHSTIQGIRSDTENRVVHAAPSPRERGNLIAEPLSGEIEVDETYLGSLKAGKHESKKMRPSRGALDNQAFFGLRERDGEARAVAVSATDKATFQGVIEESVVSGLTS